MSPDMREKSKETAEMAKPWQIFAKDLYIVGEGERLFAYSPFEAPPSAPWDKHGHHNYHLTVWNGTDDEYRERLSPIKMVAVGCMDWRFNRALYDEALKKGYKPEEIMIVTVAGGVAQEPKDRQEALKIILGDIYKNALNLEEVGASGHVDRCGAFAVWWKAEIGKLPVQMGTEIGGPEEISQMSRLVAEGIGRLPKAPEKVKVFGMLLGLESMNEERHQLKVKSIFV
jgi:hypothetical protein